MRIDFKCGTGSGSSFYLNANTDTDPDPESQTNASHKKFNFCMKNILEDEGTKAFLKTRFVCQFWSISLPLDPYPDPRQPNECGSGCIRIRIYNTTTHTTGLIRTADVLEMANYDNIILDCPEHRVNLPHGRIHIQSYTPIPRLPDSSANRHNFLKRFLYIINSLLEKFAFINL